MFNQGFNEGKFNQRRRKLPQPALQLLLEGWRFVSPELVTLEDMLNPLICKTLWKRHTNRRALLI